MLRAQTDAARFRPQQPPADAQRLVNEQPRLGALSHTRRAVRRGAAFAAVALVGTGAALWSGASASAPTGDAESTVQPLLLGVQGLLAVLFLVTLVQTWMLHRARLAGDRRAALGCMQAMLTALWWSLGLLVVQAMAILIPLAVDASERREPNDLWPSLVGFAVLPATMLWFWLNELYTARAEVRNVPTPP